MCGIAGLVRLERNAAPPPASELGRISAALARRGPDGEGEWRSPTGGAALAHRRLAILDPSPAGAQPMATRDGRFVLVFNGEIYDFRRHREALDREGVELATASDTEVLLHLVARRGPAVLSSLRGMYAFALWDEREGELVLARDPYGIRPLYYAIGGGWLRFASQVRALEAGGAIPDEVDRKAVAGFLCWGAVPEPRTIRRAVRSLPAGHVLRASVDGGVRIEATPFRRAVEEPADFGAAVVDSIRDHLVSDVPVAVFLSAGLDSSLIAAVARRELAEPPTALTLAIAETRGTPADEVPLACATAARLGLPHVVREVGAADVRALLPEILTAMDQPSIDGFNTFLIARLARESGFKVALSGLGGDELLGGYASFRDVPGWQRRARALGRLPGLAALWPSLARLAAPAKPKLAGLLEHGRSIAGAYFLRRGLHLPRELGANGYDPVLDAWEAMGESILGAVSGLLEDPWHAVHRLESNVYLRRQLLRDADWAGLGQGVEIRVPLVDARLRLVAEAAGFEPARSGGKAALVRALAPELPASLFGRAKTGFQLPIGQWLEPDAGSTVRRVGSQSRKVARIVLSCFDVDAEQYLRGSR
ncbi:MAG: asparagine synthetase B [Acidobacteriota bacterium]